MFWGRDSRALRSRIAILGARVQFFPRVQQIPLWIRLFICGVAASLLGQGQALPEWMTEAGVPKPPSLGIRDDSGFFLRDEAAFERISQKILKLEADHGYRIYLMVEPSLIGTTASELSSQLRQAWIPDTNGLVVVFETDSRSLGIGRNPDSPSNLENSTEVMPTHEAAAAIRRAIQAADSALMPAAYIESLMENLVAQCNDYFVRRDKPVTAGRTLRIWLLAIGGLTLLGLGAIVLGWLIRHTDRKSQLATFHFPAVDRPERFGAPCGASVTARRFGRQESKPQ